MRLTLASTSVVRRTLLSAAGVSFEACAPGVDEEALTAALVGDGVGPRDLAGALAETKAVKVSRARTGLVIGADQTLDQDGQLLSKPASLPEARERLLRLRGRDHRLHSAVTIARDGQAIWRTIETARLHARDYSDAFIDDYMAREGQTLLASTGAYRLEAAGVQLFTSISGDYFTILGLPLWPLLEQLRRLGAISE